MIRYCRYRFPLPYQVRDRLRGNDKMGSRKKLTQNDTPFKRGFFGSFTQNGTTVDTAILNNNVSDKPKAHYSLNEGRLF